MSPDHQADLIMARDFPEWEYRACAITAGSTNTGAIERDLNVQGAACWELVTVHLGNAIFKRKRLPAWAIRSALMEGK